MDDFGLSTEHFGCQACAAKPSVPAYPRDGLSPPSTPERQRFSFVQPTTASTNRPEQVKEKSYSQRPTLGTLARRYMTQYGSLQTSLPSVHEKEDELNGENEKPVQTPATRMAIRKARLPVVERMYLYLLWPCSSWLLCSRLSSNLLWVLRSQISRWT